MADAGSGDLFAALFAAHQVGDFWVQTNRQSADKGLPGVRGHRACAAHAVSMAATKAAGIALLHASGRKVAWKRAAAALAADAVTHYAADRRAPLRALAGLLDASTGKLTFYRLGSPREGRDDNPTLGTGAFHLDQAFHIACLWGAALIASAGERERS